MGPLKYYSACTSPNPHSPHAHHFSNPPLTWCPAFSGTILSHRTCQHLEGRATFYWVLHTAQHSTSNIHWMEEAHSFAAIDNLVNIPFLFRVCVFICILVCLFLFIKLQEALEEELGRKSQDDQTISWDLGFQFFFKSREQCSAFHIHSA